MKEVVVTYSDTQEFRANLIDLLTEGEKHKASQNSLETFLELNSAEAAASRYINLFESMLEEKRAGTLPQFFRSGPDPKHMEEIHSQLAIGHQAANLQSPHITDIFKSENIKGIESQQSTIP
jgi:hypothetical protein